MGAFIAYLHQAEGIRHFFVLAPNLTIYNKLIADFTPGSPKYVLQGLSDFVIKPPEIITGDNYESRRGVRAERLIQPAIPGFKDPDAPVHINIFNISKINSEVRGRGAAHQTAARVHRRELLPVPLRTGRPCSADGRVAPLSREGRDAGHQ
jgi:hypothetical protein